MKNFKKVCTILLKLFISPLGGWGAFIPIMASAQFSITGSVTEATLNKPMAFATVALTNTYITTVTNSSGAFEFKNLKAGDYVLSVSYLGYEIQEQKISLDKNINLNIQLQRKAILQEEVAVSATKASTQSGMAFTELSKKEIEKTNFGQDIPYLLQLQPSTVATSDAGTGVGYTGLRIRGSDASRINVTVNGIPLNDAESQQLYWVNMPDLASSADNIQVQRGVGTSTNGASAFGGSINITTSKTDTLPFGELNLSAGSFCTFKRNVKAGTGLLNNHFAFEARLSQITSVGYVDRATADLSSYFITGTYFGKNNILRLNLISGKEKTYQAWNGVPQCRIDNDTTAMLAFIDRNYFSADEAANLLNSGRTYNYFTYQNQTDNYQQKHYQLFYSQQINTHLNANFVAYLTRGEGYYEELKNDQSYADYNMTEPIVGVDTITTTNLVRQKWLGNDFYGTTFSVNYDSQKKLQATIGGAYTQYYGDHFGNVIWAEYYGNNPLNYEYYYNNALKKDFNIYAKATYSLSSKCIAFGDFQYRYVNYSFKGYDVNLNTVNENEILNFINPKAGITFRPDNNQSAYISFSVGNHEPSRDDYVNSSATSHPTAETLYDIEVGYRYNNRNFTAGFNNYFMIYKNQLVLTGKLNDVGEYTRTNIENSYREGIELDAGYRILSNLQVKANTTISQSKIKVFNEYVDDYDNGEQIIIEHDDAEIAFSPNLIANGIVSFEPIKNLSADFIFQYVGQQFLDNTSNENRILKAYSICNLRFNYAIGSVVSKQPKLDFGLQISNLLNQLYESNGYTYSYFASGQTTTENFYFPQAGINYMASIRVRF
jgi:iron complex outermembrane receptor protein